MSYGEQTRGKSVSPRGVWLFENLKSPQRQRFHQMNRSPFSKASCLAAGKGTGRRERVGLAVVVGRGGGEISRQRADTIKTRENELLNTSIKKYKTWWPRFYAAWAVLQAGDKVVRVVG